MVKYVPWPRGFDLVNGLSSLVLINFELFVPFFFGDWGAYLYHVILIKVARIVSTQKANCAARFIAPRDLLRGISRWKHHGKFWLMKGNFGY